MKIDLRTPKLREVPVGIVVISSKGFEFELVERDNNGKEKWKDLITGIVWYDVEEHLYDYDEALKKFGKLLPSIEDFKIAESHGFREVLPNFENRWFWSSSLYSSNKDGAWYFYGNNGSTAYDYFRNYDYSVRCAGR